MQYRQISIHAPRAGRDLLLVISFLLISMYFNPRAPCGARPACFATIHATNPISIHAPRAGRDQSHVVLGSVRRISIHAPRAGRDPGPAWGTPGEAYFNPRAPCGARLPNSIAPSMTLPFQSTRPVRGATRSGLCGDRPQWHFNPRAPCGARLRRYPPREKKHKFQSTRPVRGATRAHLRAAGGVHISIHAPRAGRDQNTPQIPAVPGYFNPRAPCGARLVDIYGEDAQGTFQSTRPVRGATEVKELFSGTAQFQSTRPVRGATLHASLNHHH